MIATAGSSDDAWAKRQGIVCRYPDGANRCAGCPHYVDPKKNPDCTFAVKDAPLSDSQINHANIANALLRLICAGWRAGVDRDHGLRIRGIAHDGNGGLLMDLADGVQVDITFTHSVPRCVPATAIGKPADARV